MGCCSKESKKTSKDQTKKTTKNPVKKKKQQLDEKTKKTVNIKAPAKTVSNEKKKIKEEEPPPSNQPLVQAANPERTHVVSSEVETKPTKRRSPNIASPNDDDFETFINLRSSDDNIHALATLDELQRSVKQNEKPVSIVLFYARYCPYSKRTMPDLRQWARSNKDRIVLYEADVEQASNLAHHYHVRTIPTLMAFNEQNLLAPIWQRTANQVLATDFETPPEETPMIVEIEEKTIDPSQFEEIFRTKLHPSNNLVLLLDPSLKGSDRMLKVNETPNLQEQYLVILDQRDATSPESRFLIAITNERGVAEVVGSIDPSNREDESQIRSKTKSIASSQKSPYIWNQSTEKTSEQSSMQHVTEDLNPETEYQGRLISRSALSTIADGEQSSLDQSTRKRTWKEHTGSLFGSHRSFVSPLISNDYGQDIHLPACNELFYEKHYSESPSLPLNHSPSFDRLSTLTYEHIKDAARRFDSDDQQEEVCVLYLGPNRRRGFEENLPERNPVEANPSKLSLLTLKSHSFVE